MICDEVKHLNKDKIKRVTWHSKPQHTSKLRFFYFQKQTPHQKPQIREEELNQTLPKTMKSLVIISVMLGMLVTGLDSVSFEISRGTHL